ncbi:MAG: heme/copper-type cytochrome/quinol oxidase, subunit 3 [Bacteroidetes bacterium]|nr:heme/copper-type cytochrome/quinol oxidase, subunit 3 [Bacteroidota bacterium]
METISVEEKRVTREKVAKPMLYLAMGSMFMIFAAFTSAYIVRQQKGDWLKFDVPQIFYISTAVILLSSVTMNWAVTSAKKNDLVNLKRASLITLLLGCGFVICQFFGWSVLFHERIVFAGKISNASGSFFYVITGIHLAHLLGGIIALFVVWIKSTQQKYNSENLLGVSLCAIFWHFLDLLWIGLFLFLLFER